MPLSSVRASARFRDRVIAFRKVSLSRLSLFLSILIVFTGVLPGCSAGPRKISAAALRPPRLQAPELSGGDGWLNTENGKPVTLKDLKGKVVLLDFWTYCCINCMHIIPTLKQIESKYGSELVVVGVHSGKFDNEKHKENIRNAVLRYGVQHPVVDDADFKIWNAYGVHSWPTLVLIDPSGNIVGRTAGEEDFASLDREINAVVDDFGKAGELDREPLKLVAPERATEGVLSYPGKIAAGLTTSGGKALWISDSDHNRILQIDLTGKVLTEIGTGEFGSQNGAFVDAQFKHPQGVFQKGDKLYIADTENHMIRIADLKSKEVSTVAGTGKQAPTHARGGKGTEAALSSPWDLTMVNGKFYIAMAGDHQIWQFDPKTLEVHPYIGSGKENLLDGPLATARLAQPSGITTDGVKLFFVDSEASAVRQADVSASGTVKTIVGEGLFEFGDKDGSGKSVRLQHPLGITFNKGKLLIADSYNHKIKSVVPPGAGTPDGETRTLFGTGSPGYKDGRTGLFSEPGGLVVVDDKIYIADT
ncbi:MAG TPA: thioredoxin-like domain-containing protein, partial [Chroococcales cyanobacterium]